MAQEPEIAPNSKREQLVAEIERLHKKSLEFLADGAFGGWTGEEEAMHEKRSTRLAQLLREIEGLDGEK